MGLGAKGSAFENGGPQYRTLKSRAPDDKDRKIRDASWFSLGFGGGDGLRIWRCSGLRSSEVRVVGSKG